MAFWHGALVWNAPLAPGPCLRGFSSWKQGTLCVSVPVLHHHGILWDMFFAEVAPQILPAGRSHDLGIAACTWTKRLLVCPLHVFHGGDLAQPGHANNCWWSQIWPSQFQNWQTKVWVFRFQKRPFHLQCQFVLLGHDPIAISLWMVFITFCKMIDSTGSSKSFPEICYDVPGRFDRRSARGLGEQMDGLKSLFSKKECLWPFVVGEKDIINNILYMISTIYYIIY